MPAGVGKRGRAVPRKTRGTDPGRRAGSLRAARLGVGRAGPSPLNSLQPPAPSPPEGGGQRYLQGPWLALAPSGRPPPRRGPGAPRAPPGGPEWLGGDWRRQDEVGRAPGGGRSGLSMRLKPGWEPGWEPTWPPLASSGGRAHICVLLLPAPHVLQSTFLPSPAPWGDSPRILRVPRPSTTQAQGKARWPGLQGLPPPSSVLRSWTPIFSRHPGIWGDSEPGH